MLLLEKLIDSGFFETVTQKDALIRQMEENESALLQIDAHLSSNAEKSNAAEILAKIRERDRIRDNFRYEIDRLDQQFDGVNAQLEAMKRCEIITAPGPPAERLRISCGPADGRRQPGRPADGIREARKASADTGTNGSELRKDGRREARCGDQEANCGSAADRMPGSQLRTRHHEAPERPKTRFCPLPVYLTTCGKCGPI